MSRGARAPRAPAEARIRAAETASAKNQAGTTKDECFGDMRLTCGQTQRFLNAESEAHLRIRGASGERDATVCNTFLWWWRDFLCPNYYCSLWRWQLRITEKNNPNIHWVADRITPGQAISPKESKHAGAGRAWRVQIDFQWFRVLKTDEVFAVPTKFCPRLLIAAPGVFSLNSKHRQLLIISSPSMKENMH